MTQAPHILIVDDSADNRGLLAQLLEDDHRLSMAADGHAAIAAIERDRPDLVLLDLMMPGLDGFGVLSWLREQAGAFLPVLVVSAASEREARLRALRLGAHEFIGKPVDGEELQVRVGTLLALKAARAERERALESEVVARTAELQSALVRLQAADRYKDEFLSVISHELRTPLNFIMGFASILDDEVSGPMTAEQHGHVGKILEGADRMLGLVDDLLDQARVQAGNYHVSPAPADYGALVSGVAATLAPLAARKGLALHCDVALAQPVRVDAQRIVQVITNLLGNAIKFTDAGAVSLHVWVEADTIVTEVRDSGPGIAEADLPRLFQRFGQLDSSNTRQAGGAGLGLAISKAIVEAHGGDIGVLSRPGAGATFHFRLPLQPLPAAPAPLAERFRA